MNLTKRLPVIAALSAVVFGLTDVRLAYAVNVSATNGHADVLPYVQGNTIESGYFDFDASAVVENTRLFVRDLGVVQPSLFGSTNPGFTTAPGYGLLASQDLMFDAVTMPGSDGQARNLLYWDGMDEPDFGAPRAGDDFYIRRSSALNATLDGGPTPIPGFSIDTTNPNGEMHKHISFQARGAGATQPGDGYYLFGMQFQMNGLEDAEPIYFLFSAAYLRNGQGEIQYNGNNPITNTTSQDLAVTWVLDNLLTSALPGDADGDGDIDDSDLGTSFANYTGPVGAAGNKSAAQGDTDGDGDVDDSDLGTSFAAYTGPIGAAAAVPEPTSALVLLVVGGLIARRRR